MFFRCNRISKLSKIAGNSTSPLILACALQKIDFPHSNLFHLHLTSYPGRAFPVGLLGMWKESIHGRANHHVLATKQDSEESFLH